MMKRVIGILGGSGLTQLDVPLETIATSVRSSPHGGPWGEPSGDLYRGQVEGVEVVFLSRHGKGHRISPSQINVRANMDAFKRAGVTDIVSFSACASFREEIAPGDFVLVDQMIDKTRRESSFFGTGCVVHVSMADPVCLFLRKEVKTFFLQERLKTFHQKGTYLAMEGPQFSTRAESRLYQSWGCDLLGMTGMPEAKLAREAEMSYVMVAMVCDYDCWRDDVEHVEVNNVMEHLGKNAQDARDCLPRLIQHLGAEREQHEGDTVLDRSVITAPEYQDPKVMAKMDAIMKRYFLGKHFLAKQKKSS